MKTLNQLKSETIVRSRLTNEIVSRYQQCRSEIILGKSKGDQEPIQERKILGNLEDIGT